MRIPRAGLLGSTMTIADRTQAAAKPGTVRCSEAAYKAYLASSYTFDMEDDAPFPEAHSPVMRGDTPFCNLFASAKPRKTASDIYGSIGL